MPTGELILTDNLTFFPQCPHRHGLGIALFVAILLIWTVFLIGLFCGVFGYSSQALPYERSQVSTCGARLLLLWAFNHFICEFSLTQHDFLSAVGLSFLSGGLLLILSSFMYFGSTALQKICNDLAPPEYTVFQRIFDDRQVWNGRTLVGSILQSQLNIDSNISITTFLRWVYDFLFVFSSQSCNDWKVIYDVICRECEDNSPIYEALQVESFFDLDQLLSNFNFTNIIDVSQQR